jgi:hypothetical protein
LYWWVLKIVFAIYLEHNHQPYQHRLGVGEAKGLRRKAHGDESIVQLDV